MGAGDREDRVGDVRKAADHDVLRIASDRRGGPDVRGHRHGEQVGRRPPFERDRQVQHERRQHEADRVVDQEGGEKARGGDDRREQNQRTSRARHDPNGGEGEEAGEPQARDDDHHPEQQRNGLEIDRLVGVLKRQGARCDHQSGADESDARSVDAEAGNASDRQRKIAAGKDDARRDVPAFADDFVASRQQIARQRRPEGDCEHEPQKKQA
jgi:hypothetical protein